MIPFHNFDFDKVLRGEDKPKGVILISEEIQIHMERILTSNLIVISSVVKFKTKDRECSVNLSVVLRYFLVFEIRDIIIVSSIEFHSS